jgi:hypothetical protein
MSTVLFEPVCPDQATTNVRNEDQVYCKDYTISDVVKDLVSFYELAPGISMSQYLASHSTIPKTTFFCHYRDSKLFQMKKNKESVSKA